MALYIESALINDSLIVGQLNVRRNEGETALMDFTLKTASGVQDINQYTGKDVRLDVIADSGVYRLFTGKIDYPVIDLIGKRIKFQCSNNRKNLINELDVSMIGIWSDALFNELPTAFEELDQRLKTTPQTLDFDPENNYTINDINPKVTPDFTLQDADIFYRQPSVSVVPSSEIINNVDVEFGYRYERLRQRERRFQIGTATMCEMLGNVKSFIHKKDALDNVENIGWKIKTDSVGYIDIPPSGFFTCNGVTQSWVFTLSEYDWALSVLFTAAYRYAQRMTEDYTLTVTAPQSIAQYGQRDSALKHSLDVDFDVSNWENNDTYESTDELTASTKDYYRDESGENTDYEAAIKTALNIAKTDIIRSHRKNTVTFETPLFPTLDLKHTLKVDATSVVATGKVTSISHTIDVNTRRGSSDITISFSTAEGSQSEDILTAPTRADSTIVGETYEDELLIIEGTADDIVTPAIDDLSRETHTVTSAQTYNVEIPDNGLVVTF